jgi:hypothetical protein
MTDLEARVKQAREKGRDALEIEPTDAGWFDALDKLIALERAEAEYEAWSSLADDKYSERVLKQKEQALEAACTAILGEE